MGMRESGVQATGQYDSVVARVILDTGLLAPGQWWASLVKVARRWR